MTSPSPTPEQEAWARETATAWEHVADDFRNPYVLGLTRLIARRLSEREKGRGAVGGRERENSEIFEPGVRVPQMPAQNSLREDRERQAMLVPEGKVESRLGPATPPGGGFERVDFYRLAKAFDVPIEKVHDAVGFTGYLYRQLAMDPAEARRQNEAALTASPAPTEAGEGREEGLKKILLQHRFLRGSFAREKVDYGYVDLLKESAAYELAVFILSRQLAGAGEK